MARRSRTVEDDTNTTVENTEENDTVTTAETDAQTDALEAELAVNDDAEVLTDTEAEGDEPKAKGKAKKDETPVDLTAFTEAVSAAIEAHDNSSGLVPDEAKATVTAEYRKLDGAKAKNAARKQVEEAMRDSMAQMNLGLARAYMALADVLTPGKAEKAEKEPADPTEAVVQRSAGLNLAVYLIEPGEGVAADWQDQAHSLANTQLEPGRAYLAWLQADEETRGDEPDVPAWVQAAVKLSLGKSARVSAGRKTPSTSNRSEYTGERRDIAKHIEEVFSNVESGTFLTIGEIVKGRSEEYGEDAPSSGAVSARLFPKGDRTCSLEFVRPEEQNGKKGAVKV